MNKQEDKQNIKDNQDDPYDIYKHIVESTSNLKTQILQLQRTNIWLTIAITISLTITAASIATLLTTPSNMILQTKGDYLRIIPLKLSSGIAASETGIANWTAKIVRETLTLSFTSYKDDLFKQKKNYRIDALKTLIASMKKEGMINALERRKNTLATSDANARVTASSNLEGLNTWKIETPFLFSFETTSGASTPKKLIARVVVQFDPENVSNDSGLIIHQIIITTR